MNITLSTGCVAAPSYCGAAAPWRLARRALLPALLLAGITAVSAAPACAADAYTPITPSMADRTITLTGHDLSIEDIVAVARYGAKVRLSPEAQQREADNYGLLLEATREGIAVYWFNRGAGDQRETVLFQGDALTPENKA
ncbi:MAG TPA: aromatic amino acid lyase, partial [Steroidobacteraceae bacterium]|nr:aromatic amino acid lyase [Steroidobacteraceae bacterium]